MCPYIGWSIENNMIYVIECVMIPFDGEIRDQTILMININELLLFFINIIFFSYESVNERVGS
jgi:hypothetical protein